MRVGARIEVTGLPRDTELAICRALTYRNPEHGRRERLGLWTGDTDPHIATWSRIPGGISVPRGTGRRIVALLKAQGVSYHLEDETVCPPLGLRVTPGTLRPYQQHAHDDLRRHVCGVCEGKTGAGKTNIGASLIATKGTSALVLVHTTDLVHQWHGRLGTWLGVEAGVIGGGKCDIQPITVATVQSLVKRDIDDIAPRFGLVLVDECHHAPAWQYASVLDRLPARYKYGLTATPWRKDGLDMVIADYLGPVVARIDPAHVRDAGATVPARVEIVESAWRYRMTDAPNAWSLMLSALVDSHARNDLLANEVRRRVDAGAAVVVLTDRVAHVEALAERLADRRPIVLHGGLTTSERAGGMAAVRAGARLTIATAQLLGEGIDVPGWDCLVMASPFAGGPRTLQAVGRVVRPAPGKTEAVVVDVVDIHVPALVAAHYSRCRLYQEAA